MRILFKNAEVLRKGRKNVVVEGEYIRKICDTDISDTSGFDRVIDCSKKLLMPGLYNCHTHAAMTLFRGYGEDMPLDRWLHEKIFPAEELLTNESVYTASLYACAEMIRGGIVSFTDMYEKCGETCKAVAMTGMKANISRSVLSFDKKEDMSTSFRLNESKSLFREWHNAEHGRIKIDMSVHAEYTNNENSCRATAAFAVENGTHMHIHLSETQSEHEECKKRNNGRTPAEFMRDCGIFDVPATAAHCVYVTDSDMDLMHEKGVFAAHNPTSNLKLGSGIMRTSEMLKRGVGIVLGTDGAASNNTLNIFKEMHLAAVLDKGATRDPGGHNAYEFVRMATENGAASQGRTDCGIIEEGKKADIILVDLDSINNIPMYDPCYTAVYSASAGDVSLTMCDGRILYENGEFLTVDIEKLKSDMRHTCENYFKENK
ncbi:MAG: amidohydrolase [Firmicutes bacterium]|nr:amidohydrolase [Bacillota bacterium]